ncbi:hypothetical protein ANSO36C_02630 [Nostoc cf. commune SO-36]|uniref:Ribulose bisphosphate carboxylase small subunit domain-containing protein n=1 Tax=Nostoc cf. commune SO-36 TaxID=449208 RepID=A0ABM7YUZ7_NOSCO|nr:ribulose bisphosphate carboxylase small subunit [Nostoc commune]BDI14461.1 hypothetical protein ANSO36C_02630 [Nostoc cf. commune SO-36]
MTYYIAPRFLHKLSVHITKNFLDLPGVRVPLILGIHGHKGEGKSFQCELVFDLMGVEPIHVSAGELESPDAGDPARMIRLRYREAADYIRTHGKMAVLMINDLDAGAGRVDGATQYTVNTQLINATLMNIADNPTNVQLPGSYDSEPLPRIPVIVTGNDFGTLYAPLVRDGRMDKFYWQPNREDKIGIVSGIFEPDGISKAEIEELVDRFAKQSVDFFGALRSQIYDEQILSFIQKVGFNRVGSQVVNSKEKPTFHKPDFDLSHLIAQGELMVKEQRQLEEMRLASRYNRALHESQAPRVEASIPAPTVTPTPAPKSSNVYTHQPVHKTENHQHSNGNGTATNISEDLLGQLRSILSQGYSIGLEHVDARRFRTGSWASCATVQTQDEKEVIAALEACLSEHNNEYVRLFGIDPGAKRRVLETIIQRPEH